MTIAEATRTDEEGADSARLYRHRFPHAMRAQRNAVWKIICKQWLARYIPPAGSVLEVGAGYCEFINNIHGSEKVGVDINPEIFDHAGPDVTAHQISAESLANVLPRDHFDTVFISNFLEHCASRESMLSILRASAAVLKREGRILVLGPNFRYCYQHYFDYFDHRLALTEKAVVEALQLSGLEIELVKSRTLPFTFHSRLPAWPWLVSLYLKVPVLWRLFGAQYLVIGRRMS